MAKASEPGAQLPGAPMKPFEGSNPLLEDDAASSFSRRLSQRSTIFTPPDPPGGGVELTVDDSADIIIPSSSGESDKKSAKQSRVSFRGANGASPFSNMVDEMGAEESDAYNSAVDNTDNVSQSTYQETALDDTKRQLEDLQMRTVYTLVEDVEIESDGMVR